MLKKKQDHAICPFCCHRFHPNQADFRIGGDRKLLDDNLYNYHVDILHTDTVDAKVNSMQYPFMFFDLADESIFYDESDIEKYGFAQRITFENEKGKVETSDQRLCPNCHNNLPIGYGMRETVLISILGDARSGKSIFLTMLIAELENNPDFVSKLTFIGDKQVRDSFYSNYQRPLFKEHALISSTKRKKIPPYSFNYWYQYKGADGSLEENSIDVIFYDIAGEDLRDESGIRNNGFNIKDSSGLIFLVDPTNFTKLSDLFRYSDSALIEAIPEENSTQAIFDTLYNYFIGFDMEKSPIPFALAVSKVDLFKYVNFDFFNNKPESRIQHILKDEIHQGVVNMPSIKGLHREVRELISHLSEDGIINNAMGCFKNMSCFALSSLGKKPIIEKISDPETNETIEKGFVDGSIIPFRVKEPFYWILMRNRLILKYENGRHYRHGDTVPKEGAADAIPIWRKILNFFAGWK